MSRPAPAPDEPKVDRAKAAWSDADFTLERALSLHRELALILLGNEPLPEAHVKQIRKDVNAFTEKFNIMLHEQKRKVRG